jgi:hypothetical protein
MAKAKKVEIKGRIKIWSPSAFSLWSKCNRRAGYKHVMGMRDKGGYALDRGEKIHEAIEGYIAGRLSALPPLEDKPMIPKPKGKVMKLIDALRAKFKKRLVRTELFLAFDRKWKKTDGSNKNPDKWLGLKIDAIELFPDASVVKPYDWKTGKLKKESDSLASDYDDQVHLYNVAALSAGYPGKKAEAELVYTDHDTRIPRPQKTVNLPVLRQAQEEWEDKVAPMFADRIFAPRPSNECRWCPYSVNNDGPCEF